MALRQILGALRVDVHARAVRWFRSREIIKTLALAHAQELREVPGEQWGLVKQRQAAEIQAVKDGKFDIVDRRSWTYPYLPEALHRLNQPILKNTPYNLRRFSETPIPRRAINLVKNAILSLNWKVEKTPDAEETPDLKMRQQIATDCLRRPNNTDSWHSLMEAVAEDTIIGGYGCIEPRLTPYVKRPFKAWAVDGSTIRIFADWSESMPDKPRYAQMTGLKGERGYVTFLNSELIYIRNNVRASTPFGLGMLEVAFNSVNALLGAQDMASKAGSDQVHKTWLWWESAQNPSHLQTVRRHIQNELEGQAKVSILAGMKKPDVLDITPVNPNDLLLDWQEFLIRIIANAFDISAFALGLEKDVNRNTSETLATADFRSAVVPMARRFEEAISRELIQSYLGWKDLQFRFVGLDDPDPATKATIQQRQYQMDALTSDEIREDMGKPPLPGGWGQLTQTQKEILLAEAQAKAKAAAAGGAAGGGGAPPTPTGDGEEDESSAPASPTGRVAGKPPMPGAKVSSAQVAKMSIKGIEKAQEKGQLPRGKDLLNALQEQTPGILDQLGEEVVAFIEKQEDEDRGLVQPAKPTAKEARQQVKRFLEEAHSESVLEQQINDRNFWQNKQPLVKGKYPRSGGKNGQYR